MQALKTGNLAVKFVLELVAFAAFAYWGATVGTGVVSVLVAIAASGAAVVLWARFAAPRSSRRLPTALRAPFELCVFGLAAVALAAAAGPVAALVFALAVLVNAVLLTVFGQWSENDAGGR
jgi:cobalamin synthase